tara:strand:+ start:44288 stop:46162 length:1875 start_codon:yes stop_codon:yes gene_type:complete
MENFLIYLVKSCGIIVLFWITFQLFLKRETFFEHHRFFLLLGIFISVSLPLWTLKNFIEVAPQQFQNLNFELAPTVGVLETNTLNWIQLLFTIYIIGAIAFSFRFILQLFSLRSLLKKCTLQKEGKFTFATTKETVSPFSFFNTIVYNPSMYDDKAIKAIIVHEKIHANQKHSLDILLTHLFTIFQWFNPFVWLYKKAIAQNLEYIADKNSAFLLEDKKAYQYLLVHQSGQFMPHTTIINPFFNSLIKKRIVMLNQKKSKKINLVKFSFILPLLVTFLILFNTKTIAQAKETATTAQKSQWSVGYGIAINRCEISIDKNSTEENLEKEMAYVKEKANINLKFSKIKRNKNGEIIAIKSTYKTSDGKSGTYNISSDEPIATFVFSVTKDDNGNVGSIGYGPQSASETIVSVMTNTTTKSKGEHVILSPVNSKKNRITKSADSIYFNATDPNNIKEMNVVKSEDGKENSIEIVFKEKVNDPNSVEQKEVHTSAKKISWATTSSESHEPLIIIDGEIQDESIVPSSLDPEHIARVNVLKDKSAIAKYGDKAKNGVVEITTKSKTLRVEIDEEKKPLIIIDGKIQDIDVKDLDADKVKSMNVIKGKSATDTYGSQAKNGVIVITTKSE